jgi:hypothetical protein
MVQKADTMLLSALVCLTQLTWTQATSAQTVSGAMYAENFTYYKLSGEGWLRLELHSLQGDVDLYVSGHTQQPSFDDYELKSDSCGVDVVDIHSTMTRPVGIGLYAHPYYHSCAYRLDITVISESEYDEYEELFQMFHYLRYDDEEESDERRSGDGKKPRPKSHTTTDSEQLDDDEPVWWTVLLTILKFILEVIV